MPHLPVPAQTRPLPQRDMTCVACGYDGTVELRPAGDVVCWMCPDCGEDYDENPEDVFSHD